MSTENELREKVASLENQVAALQGASQRRGIRKRARRLLWGMPLYDIALGPDPDKGEVRGHARGVIAIGDIATGVLAIGGLARGLVAIGGAAFGGICFGGCAIGLIAVGGGAVGVIAIGGAAVGIIAAGGGAVGYYACGGGAFGKHVISGLQQDPEAVKFFSQWIPGMDQMLQRPGG